MMLAHYYGVPTPVTSSTADYSNSASEPTPVNFISKGNGYELTLTNSLSGTSDRTDYVRFTVPQGQRLTVFNLESYSSSDRIAFIALQSGSVVTGSAQNAVPLRGYSHFGVGAAGASIGDNLVPNLGGPLDSGDYSVWVQQLGATTDYIFRLGTEPEPTASTRYGTPRADLIQGGAGNDVLHGLAGNDTFNGGFGDDRLEGGDGSDTAIFQLARSNYVVTILSITLVTASVTSQSGNDGSDTLYGIERIHFSDSAIALDITGVAGQAYRIYKAAFDRIPDVGGLGYWIAQMDSAMDLIEVSARFVDSKEFRDLYGTNPTNAQFLTKLYQNVLGRAPEATGYNWWLNELNTNPAKNKAKVLADFSESPENQTGVASLIGNGITYEPWVG